MNFLERDPGKLKHVLGMPSHVDEPLSRTCKSQSDGGHAHRGGIDCGHGGQPRTGSHGSGGVEWRTNNVESLPDYHGSSTCGVPPHRGESDRP